MADSPTPEPLPEPQSEAEPARRLLGRLRAVRATPRTARIQPDEADVPFMGVEAAGPDDPIDIGSSRASERAADRAADDAALMAALGDGEIDALEALYDRYATLVFSVSLRVLHDAQLAEDVVQEVYLRLWRQPTSYDPARGRFISWLMSVTRNRSLDELRRVSRRLRSEDAEENPGHELPAPEGVDDPQAGLLLAERRVAVRAAMTRLPPAQRRVIELAYFGGLTQVEIAQVTGDPLGTVKTRVRLGMQKLRESLEEFIEADGGGGWS